MRKGLDKNPNLCYNKDINKKEVLNMMKENKCYKCAELDGCYAGQHGKGNADCKCFCPCLSDKHCIIIEKSKDWIRLIDRTNLKVVSEGQNLDPEEVLPTLKKALSMLEIDFKVVEK